MNAEGRGSYEQLSVLLLLLPASSSSMKVLRLPGPALGWPEPGLLFAELRRAARLAGLPQP